VTELVILAPRRFPFLVAGVISGLLVLGWFLGTGRPEGVQIVGLAMVGGHAVAILAMLYRAFGWQSERRGWIFLSVALVCMATLSLLLTEERGHHLEIDQGRLTQACLLAVGATILTILGMLRWPLHRQPRITGRVVLNGLGGLFTGTSLWLLFWVGATWHERFQGNSAHHIHLMLLGFLVAAAGGMSAFLFLECPRRSRGPVGVLLVGLTLLTTVLGILAILQNAPGHHAGFAVLPGLPLVFALAAMKNSPAELCAQRPHSAIDLPEILPFLPFLALGPVLGLALWREGGVLLWPVLSLVAITGILGARQLLLIREFRAINQDLESRVTERTRTLVDLQTRQLRQERMNTLAMLGAGMIHDLNNSLGVVRASVDLAQMAAEDGPPALKGHLNRIHRATGQLASLSGRLMTFARSEIEAPHLLDLAEEIRHVEPLLHMLLPRMVRLSVEIMSAPPEVMASRGLIEQVLMNLVGNARDAMPEGGELRVCLKVPAESPAIAVITVADTGPGIPKQVREQLFTPFFTTKTAGRGTGLGLASTKALMEEAGGGISLESQEGRGTTITLTFPIPSAGGQVAMQQLVSREAGGALSPDEQPPRL
jgi:signal transduction histidine kinase